GGGDMELLSFTTTASTPLAKEPGLPARVSYRLEIADTDNTSYILRRTERGSLSIGEGRAYKLAEALAAVEIRFLNNGNWLNRWDSQSQGLPGAVALAVSIGTDGDVDAFRTIWKIDD
ncbi:MAG: hypothetical protein GWN87_07800, partial [Desulfuromonadales bacterium]|nr:hypothetical protein [Desulfuromonadales bacterium]